MIAYAVTPPAVPMMSADWLLLTVLVETGKLALVAPPATTVGGSVSRRRCSSSSIPAATRPSARRRHTAPFLAEQKSRPALLVIVPCGTRWRPVEAHSGERSSVSAPAAVV